MVNTADLKSADRNVLRVRVPSLAPHINTLVAQRSEQRTHNSLVIGSNPVKRTN